MFLFEANPTAWFVGDILPGVLGSLILQMGAKDRGIRPEDTERPIYEIEKVAWRRLVGNSVTAAPFCVSRGILFSFKNVPLSARPSHTTLIAWLKRVVHKNTVDTICREAEPFHPVCYYRRRLFYLPMQRAIDLFRKENNREICAF